MLIKESTVFASVLGPNGRLEHTASDDNPFDLSTFGPGICRQDFELFIKFVYLRQVFRTHNRTTCLTTAACVLYSEGAVNTLRDCTSVLKLCQIFDMNETQSRAQRRLDEILTDEDHSELDEPSITLDEMVASCQGYRAKVVGRADQDQDLETTNVDKSEKYLKLLESYKATLDKRQSLMDWLSEVVVHFEDHFSNRSVLIDYPTDR